MRPSLAQLEALYWIARLGSFHAAARHLRLTQPTISARISELEKTLGVRLFDRVRQRAELTARGREILGSVERMLKISDEISRRARETDAMRGLLRFGAVESVALLALPRLLPRLMSEHPNLKVELTLDIGSALSRKLNARELDVAILTDPVISDHITVEPIGRVELRWVAGTKLKLPQRDLRPADLRSVPILTNPNPSTVFTVISEWFGSADMEPEHVSTCNSLSLMAKLVAAGHGVAILPPAIMQAEIKSGQIRVLSTRPAVQPRVLFVAYHGEPAEYQPLVRMAVEAMRETNLLKPI